jgi:hypothetical protein
MRATVEEGDLDSFAVFSESLRQRTEVARVDHRGAQHLQKQNEISSELQNS